MVDSQAELLDSRLVRETRDLAIPQRGVSTLNSRVNK